MREGIQYHTLLQSLVQLYLLYVVRRGGRMADQSEEMKELTDLRLRSKAKKLISEKLKRELDSSSSEDEEEADSFDDVAVWIVGISFCFLMMIVMFVLLNQDNSNDDHGSRYRRRDGGRRAKSTVVDVSLSLNELYTGVEKSATISRQVVCNGGEASCQSGLCRGQRVQVHATRDMWSGRIDRTYFCRYSVKVQTFIPPGTKQNSLIRIDGKGNISPGLLQGDVVFRIHQLSHPQYRRDEKHLHTSVRISLKEALLGFSKQLKHLDGNTFTVSKKGKPTSPGEVVVIYGKGMPNGDMHVKVNVDYPRKVILEDNVIEKIDHLFP